MKAIKFIFNLLVTTVQNLLVTLLVQMAWNSFFGVSVMHGSRGFDSTGLGFYLVLFLVVVLSRFTYKWIRCTRAVNAVNAANA